MENTVNIFWFRRDLRLDDNAGLYHALKSAKPVLPVFIFDKAILDKLEDKYDRRVAFIHAALVELQKQLNDLGSSLRVYYGYPEEVFGKIIKEFNIDSVFTNNDYEPYALERDESIHKLLQNHKIGFHSYKDQVIFEKKEILKDNGQPYTVFTPYSKKWKANLRPFFLKSYNTSRYYSNFLEQLPKPIPQLEEIGFKGTYATFPSNELQKELIKKYSKTRDFPGLENGTSRLGVHLRFGTISIRQLASIAQGASEVFLNELIWREFYQMILWHFPRIGNGHAFKLEYESIEWRNKEAEFEKWCKGITGYPLVDAGMRELNETGFMHNRVRMVAASFLTKHLLIDWRWGEAYFAEKLLDFELASNNGGWQWAAGSGCDAAPYFRIFNPTLQLLKFDKQLKYVRKWIPEFDSLSYPQPMVVHEEARKRALAAYGKALQKTGG